MKNKREKQLILIGEIDNALVVLFRKEFSHSFDEYNLSICFSDLAITSKNELWKREVVFQGRKLSLDDLVHEDTNEFLDQETLVKLIKKESIVIGSQPLLLSDLESAHIKIYEDISVRNLVEVLSEGTHTSTKFFITGIRHCDFDIIQKKLIKNLKLFEEAVETINVIMDQVCLYHEDVGNKRIVIATSEIEYDEFDMFKVLCFKYPDKTIHWVEVTSQCICWQQTYFPNFYMKRKFCHWKEIVLQPDIIKNQQKDRFIFSNIADKHAFINSFEFSKEVDITLDKNSSRIVYQLSDEDAEISFKELSKDVDPVHWIKVEKGQLVWKQSHGSLDALRYSINEDRSEKLLIGENEFIESIKDPVVIIADEPGMGKSTTLVSFSEQMKMKNKADWVLLLDLRNCQVAIDNLSIEIASLKEAINFLLKVEALSLHLPLARKLIEHSLKTAAKRPFILLLDGFDEISEQHQTKIIGLLHFLRGHANFKACITTRPHKVNKLENSMMVFASKFEALPQPNRIDLLKNLWKIRLCLTFGKDELQRIFLSGDSKSTKFDIYAEKLLNKVSGTLGERISPFLGIPLQLRIIADIFREEFVAFVEADNDDTPLLNQFDLLDMYQRFIDMKFVIYFKEKKHLKDVYLQAKLLHTLKKDHGRLAFRLLFPEEEETDILVEKHEFLLLEENAQLLLIGLVQSINHRGTAFFIHNTFAEFFCASFIVEQLRKENSNKAKYETTIQFLLRQILKEKNKVVRIFLDHLLVKDLPIHKAALNNDFETVNNLLLKGIEDINCVDKLGRTAVHFASQAGNVNILKGLFRAGCGLQIADNLGRTALHYASRYGHVMVAEFLTPSSGVRKEEDIVFSDMIIKVTDCNNLNPDCLKPQIREFINCLDKSGKSSMQYAIASRYWYNAQHLLLCGVDCSGVTEEEYEEFLVFFTNSGYFTIYPISLYMAISHLSKEVLDNFCAFDGSCDYFRLLLYSFAHDCSMDYKFEVKFQGDNVLKCSNGDGRDCPNFGMTSIGARVANHADNSRISLNPFDFDISDHLNFVKYVLMSRRISNFEMYSDLISNILESIALIGHKDALKYFVELNEYNYVLMIHAAAMNNHLNIVKYLWKNYSYDEKIYPSPGNPSLHIAVKCRAGLQFFKYLVENGADINRRNSWDETPINSLVQYNGRVDIMKYLIDKGSDVTIENLFLHTPLHKAVSRVMHMNYEHLEILNVLYTIQYLSGISQDCIESDGTIFLSRKRLGYFRNMNIIGPDFDNESYLHRLIQAKHKKERYLVSLLIRCGANANYIDEEGKTPLHIACGFGKIIVQLLLMQGAWYDAKDCNGKTPLDHARSGGFRDVQELLEMIDELYSNISRIANVVSREGARDDGYYMAIAHVCNCEGNTLLHIAADFNNMFAAHLLLQCRKLEFPTEMLYSKSFRDPWNISLENSNGDTPLHIASRKGHANMIAFLLHNGASFNTKNKEGYTPRQLALGSNHSVAVKLLKYAERNFSCLKLNDHLEDVVFTRNSAMITAKDLDGRTLLHWAAQSECCATVELLIRNGLNIERIDYNCLTPLHYAVEIGESNVLKNLLQNGAIFNALNSEEKTPLDLSVHQSAYPIRLIDKLFKDIQCCLYRSVISDLERIKDNNDVLKIVIKARDNLGNTLLHYAAREDCLDIVKFLIEKGASCDIRNDEYKTPRDLAHHLDIICFLLYFKKRPVSCGRRHSVY